MPFRLFTSSVISIALFRSALHNSAIAFGCCCNNLFEKMYIQIFRKLKCIKTEAWLNSEKNYESWTFYRKSALLVDWKGRQKKQGSKRQVTTLASFRIFQRLSNRKALERKWHARVHAIVAYFVSSSNYHDNWIRAMKNPFLLDIGDTRVPVSDSHFCLIAHCVWYSELHFAKLIRYFRRKIASKLLSFCR